MKSPETPEQLADAIESLVASYMDEVRLTVQRAVERSLTRGVAPRASSKGNDSRGAATRAATKRRTQTELGGVCEELYERVRSVGKRHLMRYFPAVVRAAAGKE